jgi:hypothetical protein
MLVPAISRRNAFTSRVVTPRTVPSSARYWNKRRPGNGRSRPMALTRRGAVNSLVTIFAPLERNFSVIDSPYVVTLDLSSVAAPHVPLSRV